MTPPRLPADQRVRDRVTTDFETTLLLEAGAGTGKTTVLVKRILALLRAGRAPIDRIVAITFTDKAAGELKGRLRDDIEEALESASGEEKERLSRAAADLERAPVSTIHAFASSLLRERPFEAGLDPGFAVAAEVASDRTFDDAWDAWLEERMAEGDAVLVRAMTCGLKLDALKAAARTVVKERDILGREETAPPFGADSLLDRVRAAVATLRGAEGEVRRPGRRRLPLGPRPRERPRPGGAARPREPRAVLPRDARRLQPGHSRGTGSRGAACTETKDELKAVRKAQEAYLAASSAHLAWALRDRLRGFLAAYEKAKADAAVVDFQDLLLRARDVLQSSIPVRRYFQRRFDFVLVDEFQDTDPLQAEIAFLLAEDPEGEPAADWRGCRLKPGKLFVVGDPKQSIYRFRRADIAVYEETKRLVEGGGGETLALTTNFRTVPSIVSFVNERFDEVFADPELDPDPRPLVAHRDEVDRGGARTLALAVPPERLPEDGDRKVGSIVPAHRRDRGGVPRRDHAAAPVERPRRRRRAPGAPGRRGPPRPAHEPGLHRALRARPHRPGRPLPPGRRQGVLRPRRGAGALERPARGRQPRGPPRGLRRAPLALLRLLRRRPVAARGEGRRAQLPRARPARLPRRHRPRRRLRAPDRPPPPAPRPPPERRHRAPLREDAGARRLPPPPRGRPARREPVEDPRRRARLRGRRPHHAPHPRPLPRGGDRGRGGGGRLAGRRPGRRAGRGRHRAPGQGPRVPDRRPRRPPLRPASRGEVRPAPRGGARLVEDRRLRARGLGRGRGGREAPGRGRGPAPPLRGAHPRPRPPRRPVPARRDPEGLDGPDRPGLRRARQARPVRRQGLEPRRGRDEERPGEGHVRRLAGSHLRRRRRPTASPRWPPSTAAKTKPARPRKPSAYGKRSARPACCHPEGRPCHPERQSCHPEELRSRRVTRDPRLSAGAGGSLVARLERCSSG